MNACFNVKPPQPKYVMMWDVDIVLNHIRSLGANNTLSDKQLTHAFNDNPLLCVVSTINCYHDRTKGWRSGNGKSQLLLSFVEPHKEVVPCTIAGWLVQVMSSAGVDTSNFRAHSTRGATTSKAKAKGLSCQEIINMARWTKVSTFKRHYLRNIVNDTEKPDGHDSFQKIVLQEG